MNIQISLPLEAAPAPELTTDDVRRTLLELARLHSLKARHYRQAAKDMAAAIRIDVR